jgi:hypothetical protein
MPAPPGRQRPLTIVSKKRSYGLSRLRGTNAFSSRSCRSGAIPDPRAFDKRWRLMNSPPNLKESYDEPHF